MPDHITALIVDDSSIFRAAFEQALSGQPDIKVGRVLVFLAGIAIGSS
jgi:chemotaxis response regulator CheB